MAITASDRMRAAAYAAQHGVEQALASYADVIAAPDVRALYNALHGIWNLAAIDAGKHVLSEKPVAANAEEAADVNAAARERGVLVVEGSTTSTAPVQQCGTRPRRRLSMASRSSVCP